MTTRARAANLADASYTHTTPEAGRALQEKYEADRRSAEASRQRRNAWVQARIADGWTHAQVADALGLSRGRIGQMK